MTEGREVEIERIGARGDGVVRGGAGDTFVAFALPGERWRVGGEGAPVRLSDSEHRIAPVCPHFGRCGGCAIQHLQRAQYEAWKRGLVTEAFVRVGLEAEISALVGVPLGSRRRAVLTGRLHKAGCAVGFHEARGHTVIDLEVCPVLDARIVAALPFLRRLTEVVATGPDPVRLMVLASETGLDVCVDGFDREITIALRSELAMLAEEAGWARLTASGQEIVVRHLPQLVEGDVRVVPPPGAFVQAAGEAERVMQEIAARAATGAKRVLDLFAGIGTLTFPLARAARVLAVDSDRAALEALEAAVRGAQGLKPVEVRQRDLLLEPFARKELEPFDCVVFDPPRAGAKAQSEMIAKSVVPVVVAVSCNPATLARDLRCLVDGGYTIEKVVPVDQFVFSHHVEVIVVLRREKTRKRR